MMKAILIWVAALLWANLLKNGTALDAGNYVMVTGTRLANGGVLSQLTFFTIKPGKRLRWTW